MTALIARPEYVDHWTLKWGDLLQVSRRYLGDKGMWEFRQWIRDSIAQNKPYDKFVYELLTARGSSYENPAANYFRVTRNAKASMEKTTQLFMGVRLVCTQCHDHPFEKWTQNQYYEMAAFFSIRRPETRFSERRRDRLRQARGYRNQASQDGPRGSAPIPGGQHSARRPSPTMRNAAKHWSSG